MEFEYFENIIENEKKLGQLRFSAIIIIILSSINVATLLLNSFALRRFQLLHQNHYQSFSKVL